MSDTPRTDAAECEAHIGISHFGHQDMCDAYKFSRQLERELNAANERIKRLEEAIESVEYIINDDWKAAIRILRKSICNSWKAKEAKP